MISLRFCTGVRFVPAYPGMDRVFLAYSLVFIPGVNDSTRTSSNSPAFPHRPANPLQQHRKRWIVIVLAPDQMQLALHPFAQINVAKHHVLEHHAGRAMRDQGQAHAGVDQGQDGQRLTQPLHVFRGYAGGAQHAGQQLVEGRVGGVGVH